MHPVLAVALLVTVALLAGCGNGAPSSAGGTDTSAPEAPATTPEPAETSASGLPDPVAATRAAILAAADAGDYEQLRSVIDEEVFLSDYGFGGSQPDPVAKWQELGTAPLETMRAVLQMRHVVRETNEGTLYQWPRYNPDSEREDMTARDRNFFLSFMTEDELEQAFSPDYGYTAPRLGILADGTWWFFVAESGP
jgi:hypothetical protein